MKVETTLVAIYNAAKMSANYDSFRAFCLDRYFDLARSAVHTAIKVKLSMEKEERNERIPD